MEPRLGAMLHNPYAPNVSDLGRQLSVENLKFPYACYLRFNCLEITSSSLALASSMRSIFSIPVPRAIAGCATLFSAVFLLTDERHQASTFQRDSSASLVRRQHGSQPLC